MGWLRRNAAVVEALAAALTAFVAVAALLGVKIQLDQADALQKLQSARDSYRAHLALAVSHPEFSQPDNICHLLSSDQGASYAAFVDHLLYSAEQMLAAKDGWEPTFAEALAPHAAYICTEGWNFSDEPETAAFLARFRAKACVSTAKC